MKLIPKYYNKQNKILYGQQGLKLIPKALFGTKFKVSDSNNLNLGNGHIAVFTSDGDSIIQTDNNKLYKGQIQLPNVTVTPTNNKDDNEFPYTDYYYNKHWDYYNNALLSEYNPKFPKTKNPVTLTNAGKVLTGAKVNPEWFTMLADAGAKYGLSPEESIGLAAKETTIGNPTHDKSYYSLTHLKVPKNFQSTLNIGMGTWGLDNVTTMLNSFTYLNDNPWSKELNYVDKLYNSGKIDEKQKEEILRREFKRVNEEAKNFKLENAFDYAYKLYVNGNYNKGYPNYNQAVRRLGNDLLTSPEYQAWKKTYLSNKNKAE